jgi:hypothetical protein
MEASRQRFIGAPAAVVAGSLALAAIVLFCFDPSRVPIYPVCLFHRTTGLLCPGCGGLRAAHQLLHGHLVAAFRFNPLLILALPPGLWLGAKYAVCRARHQPASLSIRPIWLWISLAVVLGFSVWRNLPGSPLQMQAPAKPSNHQLQISRIHNLNVYV